MIHLFKNIYEMNYKYFYLLILIVIKINIIEVGYVFFFYQISKLNLHLLFNIPKSRSQTI